ncbi:MAG: hypothetical protein FJ309_10260 [Planctomycetes bacterium]|nr:hypothetical protein [Planctomycetota bacterium]
MTARITLRTAASRPAIESRVATLAGNGPFSVRDISPREAETWTLTLGPSRPGMAIGFGKVAELLVLLGREFDVAAVDCTADEALAVAS